MASLPPDDRDSYANKRKELTGTLLNNLYRVPLVTVYDTTYFRTYLGLQYVVCLKKEERICFIFIY